MDKWEISRYLIDAKKCVDSVLYIADHAEQLRFFGLRDLVEEKRNSFYINCCAVIDHTIAPKTKGKQALCKADSIVEVLYLERDKNAAHKDEDYIPSQFDTISQIAKQMKEQILHVREICRDALPDVLTLDFVPHDKVLFRALHKILAEDEEAINKKKYPMRDKMNSVTQKGAKEYCIPILDDIMDLRTMKPEPQNGFAVTIENGINVYEGLQSRQDACIKINLLCKRNEWISLSEKEVTRYKQLVRLGAYDDFDIPQPLPKDPILLASIRKVLQEE